MVSTAKVIAMPIPHPAVLCGGSLLGPADDPGAEPAGATPARKPDVVHHQGVHNGLH